MTNKYAKVLGTIGKGDALTLYRESQETIEKYKDRENLTLQEQRSFWAAQRTQKSLEQSVLVLANPRRVKDLQKNLGSLTLPEAQVQGAKLLNALMEFSK